MSAADKIQNVVSEATVFFIYDLGFIGNLIFSIRIIFTLAHNTHIYPTSYILFIIFLYIGGHTQHLFFLPSKITHSILINLLSVKLFINNNEIKNKGANLQKIKGSSSLNFLLSFMTGMNLLLIPFLYHFLHKG
jgi:hypothetical protein